MAVRFTDAEHVSQAGARQGDLLKRIVQPQKLRKELKMNRTCLLLVLRLSAIVGLTLALAGCLEPSAETTKPQDAQTLVDAMVYVKAKNGLCFGVGTTSRIDTGGKLSYTNQVVHVPCAAMGF